MREWFSNGICNFREKWQVNRTIWQAVFASTFLNFSEIGISAILRLRDCLLIAPWRGVCLPNEKSCLYLSFNNDTSKNHIKDDSWALRKKLWWFRNRLFFSRFYDGSRKREIIFYFSSNFLIILPEHIYLGWKFEGTMKLDISFILKHVFMCLIHISYKLSKYL